MKVFLNINEQFENKSLNLRIKRFSLFKQWTNLQIQNIFFID